MMIKSIRIVQVIMAAAFMLLAPAHAYAACSSPAADVGTMIYNEDQNVPQYCDDSNWIAMAPLGGFDAKAVTFGDLYMTEPLYGVTDSKKWTGSFWIRTTDANGEVLDSDETYGGAEGDISVNHSGYQVAGKFRIKADQASNSATKIIDVEVDSLNLQSGGVWHHVMFSFDTSSTSKRHIYIDGVALTEGTGAGQANYVSYVVDGVMDFTQPMIIGNRAELDDTSSNYAGDLADFWMDFGTYIDLSVPENLQKFITANGRPAFLGKSGQLPTGNIPDIYLAGDASEFAANKGTGGGFTENGALTDASTSPDDLDAGVIPMTARGSLPQTPAFNGVENVVLRGDYAFSVAGGSGNLTITDISDPDSPAIISTVNAGSNLLGLSLSGNYIYLIDNDAANGDFKIFDVTDLSAPVEVGNTGADSDYAMARGVYYNPADGYVYSLHVDGRNTLNVTDVSDPTNPVKVDVLSIPGANPVPHEVAFTNGYAVVTVVDDSQLVSVDISDPASLSIAQTVTHASISLPRDIVIEDGLAYIANYSGDNLAIFDVSDPTSMTYVGSVSDGTVLNQAKGLDKVGDYVYIPSVPNDSLTVIDVSDPANPQIISTVQDATKLNAASDLVVRGRYAYVVCQNSGNRITVVDLGSYASCVDPAGSPGQVRYNEDGHTPIYCDGDHWVAMSVDPLSEGLVGHWKLDETSGSAIADSSVWGVTGAWIDAENTDVAEETVAGPDGTALHFDGTDDKIDLGDNFSLSGGATVCAWAKPENSTTGYIFGKHNTGTVNGFYLRTSTGGTEWTTGTTISSYITSASVDADEWQHICSVIMPAPQTSTLYKNGASIGSSTTIVPHLENNIAATIGNRYDNARDFEGSIDDVYVYNRALNSTEVNALYKRGLADDGLVAYWPLDEREGKLVNDVAVGGHFGSYTGSAITYSSVAPKIGGTAMVFDGTANGIDVSSFDVNSGAITIMAWMYPFTFKDARIVSKTDGSAASDHDWMLGIDNGGSLYGRINTAGGNASVGSNVFTPASDVNQWWHVAMTYDPADTTTEFRFYKDGVASGDYDHTAGGAIVTSTKGIGIGDQPSSASGGDRTFDGLLDDVRVYDRVLTDQEILEIYNAGNAGYAASDCTSPNAAEGTMIYNTDDNAVQYCDGSGWVKLGKR